MILINKPSEDQLHVRSASGEIKGVSANTEGKTQ